jgi:hypothetical protein
VWYGPAIEQRHKISIGVSSSLISLFSSTFLYPSTLLYHLAESSTTRTSLLPPSISWIAPCWSRLALGVSTQWQELSSRVSCTRLRWFRPSRRRQPMVRGPPDKLVLILISMSTSWWLLMLGRMDLVCPLKYLVRRLIRESWYLRPLSFGNARRPNPSSIP